MASKEVVIIDGARTAIGRFGGTVKDLTAPQMGAAAARAAMERAAVTPDQIDEVVLGHARQAGCGPNVARQVAIRAEVPATAPALVLQQACISGLHAVIVAAQRILLGDADVVLAGGVEHMSSIPFLAVDQRWGCRLGDARLLDAMYKDGYICAVTNKHMGELTEGLAKRYGIGREQQDQYAYESQMGSAAGKAEGLASGMIVPVEVPQPRGAVLQFQEDEHSRPDTTIEKLAKLPPAFAKDGGITAGNASGITDGAAAMIVASKEKADELGLKPAAYIRSYAMAATEPADFGIAPVFSSRKALQRLGMGTKDMDLVEINEAFAAQVLAVMQDLDLPRAKVNVYGGAISLGHPTGMSGARLILQLIHALRAKGGRWGLAGICGNGGHGGSVVLELAE